MMRIEPLEEHVLQKLLEGDHPVLVALREQLSGLEVKERKYTGAGFVTTFSTAEGVHRAVVPPRGSPFGDVEASIDGLKHGAGFLLWLTDGLISQLEGYSYDEPWPEQVREFSLKYSEPSRRAILAKLG